MAYFHAGANVKWILLLLICVIHQRVIKCIQFTLYPNVSNMHVPEGRISTIEVVSASNCMVECYMEPDCVSVGYSEGYRSCQLYSIDMTGFQYSLVAQADTIFYKAICNQSDYTYIRPLNTCVKRHITEQNFNDAQQTCTDEAANLLILTDDDTRMYLQETMYHIHDTTFEYILGGSFDVMANWSWKNGVQIDSSNGALYWNNGEPNINNGECISMTSATGNSVVMMAANCSATYPFFCTSYVPPQI